MSTSSSILVPALLGALVIAAFPALAQAPSEAQQKALRANCPSDFREYCSGVPTGGMDALVCLEKNVDKLSPGCKSAVEAVDTPAPAATQAGTPGTGATPPTASAPPPTSPTPPQSVPPTPPAPTDNEPQLTLRQEIALAAGACAVDFRLFCPNLPVGHGNILFCLRVHGPRLAPACHDALVKAGVPMR